jgi:hypothetical protein
MSRRRITYDRFGYAVLCLSKRTKRAANEPVKQAPHPLPIFGSLWFALHPDFKQNPEDLPATPQVLALPDVPRAFS